MKLRSSHGDHNISTLVILWFLFSRIFVQSWAFQSPTNSAAGRAATTRQTIKLNGDKTPYLSSLLFSSHGSGNGMDGMTLPTLPLSVDQALQNRYACTRFQRNDGIMNKTDTAAPTANATVVELASQALEDARRAPSGFNIQPYKMIIVSNVTQKNAMGKWCCGHNAHRVRDSDCTIIFLADRQSIRELPAYRRGLLSGGGNWTTFGLLKIQVLMGLFSQGLPLPYFLSAPIGWAIRVGMRFVSWITRARLAIPTLSNPDTWSQKNTMLVAMAYLLGCTARGIQTSPMEGYCAWGIRQALGIPRRYSIPLIVATGNAYQRPTQSSDDAGMAHGPKSMTKRYPKESMVFQNTFGIA